MIAKSSISRLSLSKLEEGHSGLELSKDFREQSTMRNCPELFCPHLIRDTNQSTTEIVRKQL